MSVGAVFGVRRIASRSLETRPRPSGSYAKALYRDAAATLDDLREAVITLEEIYGTTRRVFGGQHPLTGGIEHNLQDARAALRVLWCPRIAIFEEFCDLGW